MISLYFSLVSMVMTFCTLLASQLTSRYQLVFFLVSLFPCGTVQMIQPSLGIYWYLNISCHPPNHLCSNLGKGYQDVNGFLFSVTYQDQKDTLLWYSLYISSSSFRASVLGLQFNGGLNVVIKVRFTY